MHQKKEQQVRQDFDAGAAFEQVPSSKNMA